MFSFDDLLMTMVVSVGVFLGGLLLWKTHEETKLQAQLTQCNVLSANQNAAIVVQIKAGLELQDKVNAVSKQLHDQDKKQQAFAKQIAAVTDFKTCKAAIAWGAKQSALIATRWQQ